MPIPLGIIAVAGAGAASAPAYELIETKALGSATASITFTDIPQTYKHLQLRMVVRSSSGVAVYGRFNSDTASNYRNHYLIGTGSSVVSSAGSSAESFMGLARAATTANIFGPAVIDILDYTNTNKNTTVRSLQGEDTAPTVRLTSHLWMNTNAITSITLLLNSGNLETNSRFSLYGIKG